MAERYQYRQDAAVARDSYHNDYPSERQQIENDPLAELARLIGQTDPQSSFGRANLRPEPIDQYQPQPYEQAAAAPATPGWMRTAQETNWQQPPAEDYRQAAPAYHDAPASEQPARTEYEPVEPPAFLRTARQHAAPQQRYDDVLYDQNSQNARYADQYYPDQQGGYSDDQYQQPGYGQYETDNEPPRRRGGMTTVVAVLALAVVGTGAAFAYRQFVGSPRSGEPPIIRADTGATKVVPPTQVSDAGKIVDRVGSAPGQERMIPREEQPVDLSRNAPRVAFPNLPTATPASGMPTQPQQTAVVGAVAPTQPSTALGDEPRRVPTLRIRSDQADAAPAQSAAPAPTPSRVAAARAQAPANSGPMSLSPQASQRTAAVHTSGGYVVQVSSQRSEADAQAAYRSMQSKFPNVLGSRSAMIRRADLGQRGIYYRAMVGPFAAAEDAGQLCSSLKSAGGQCVVQRN